MLCLTSHSHALTKKVTKPKGKGAKFKTLTHGLSPDDNDDAVKNVVRVVQVVEATEGSQL